HGEKTWCFKCNSEKDVGQSFVGKTYRKTRNRPRVLLYTVIVIGSLLVLTGSYRLISDTVFLNLHTPRRFHRLGHRNARRGNRVKGAEGQRPAGGGVYIPLIFPPPWVILAGRCKGRMP